MIFSLQSQPVMKRLILFSLLWALLLAVACDATDERAEWVVENLHAVINRAEQKVENPTTAADWEPVEEDFQAVAAEARELRPELEYPIQLRIDSLLNYFKATRQTYLERVAQTSAQGNAPGSGGSSPDSAANK